MEIKICQPITFNNFIFTFVTIPYSWLEISFICHTRNFMTPFEIPTKFSFRRQSQTVRKTISLHIIVNGFRRWLAGKQWPGVEFYKLLLLYNTDVELCIILVWSLKLLLHYWFLFNWNDLDGYLNKIADLKTSRLTVGIYFI